MVKDNKKFGFSLVEALMSMLIISVFFVAATKIMTHKPPKETGGSPHGFFECYYIGGKLYTHSLRGEAETPQNPAQNCNFQIPAGLSFINVHYLSGDRYFNTQETLFEQRVEISNPSAVEIQFYKQCFSDDSCSSMFKDPSAFKNYLQSTNPKSNIYRNWKPSSALFISW